MGPLFYHLSFFFESFFLRFEFLLFFRNISVISFLEFFLLKINFFFDSGIFLLKFALLLFQEKYCLVIFGNRCLTFTLKFHSPFVFISKFFFHIETVCIKSGFFLRQFGISLIKLFLKFFEIICHFFKLVSKR